MARYNVPQNLYGDPFVSALNRLEDAANRIVIEESARKSQAERDYRATMAGVMMKNAPHINWSSFGDMIEDGNSFRAGAQVYQDWLSTSQNATTHSPDGSILSENAANRLTPGIGGELVDKSVLGITRDDVNIVDQWITGNGDQARSMGWQGLINSEDIDDADLFELTDMGLIREGESWADARPKLAKRWNWWRSSYERNNESFQGISEYADLEQQEIERRNVAMQSLINEDTEYAINKQILNDINTPIRGSVLVTQNQTIKDGDQTTKVPVDYYQDINIPAGALVYSEVDEESYQVPKNTVMTLSVSELRQTILANQQNGSDLSLQFAAGLAALQEGTAVITMSDIESLMEMNDQGFSPLGEIKKVSPNMFKAITDVVKRHEANRIKEDRSGVSNYRSVNDLRNEDLKAVVAMDAINRLNLDIGANVADPMHPGMIQAFVQDANEGTSNVLPMMKDYIQGTGDPSNPGLFYRAVKMQDPESVWIMNYLKSLSQSGNLEEGLWNHMVSFGQ
tara:strand:- start:15428 stop:16960 length:1533 start_codon:yes stop_codon:yes gene_type:complete